MKTLIIASNIVWAVVFGVVSTAQAEEAIPDLRGTWSGKGQVIVLGSGDHHPGQADRGRCAARA